MSGTQNWQALGAGGLYGALASSGGGGSTNVGTARDALDLRRMGSRQEGYPDGYLGTQPGDGGRREDKLLKTIDGNHRSDQRGVHKGERIPDEDYFWPLDMRPDRGLKYAARGKKTPLVGNEPIHLVNNGNGKPLPATPSMPDPYRAAQMSSMLPPWR